MSSGSDAESRVGKLYAATGKALLRGLPREATPVHRSLGEVGCPPTCPPKSRNTGRRRKPRRSWKPFTRLRGLPREAKPFTRMAKWEIRFQRFAISFRPSALDVCRFRLPLAFSLQNLAFATGANEKFHLSPILQHCYVAEIHRQGY
jgi:hypothetical protein